MTHAVIRRILYKLVVATLGVCMPGCVQSGLSELQLRSLQNRRLYSHEFAQSYFSQTSEGQYEVVLVDEGASISPSGRDSALQASESSPLRQVVAIRIYWRPPTGTRADHPSATNATVDWYVIADSTDQMRERLHYQGAAFVRIYPQGNTARVIVRNGELSLVDSSGSLVDPLGHALVSGTFAAKRDDTRVTAITTPIRMESLARIRTAGHRQPSVPARSASQN